MSKVHIFEAFPFEVGQKIRIENAPRSGDWEVIGVTANKVTLRCPLTKKEFTWSRFCYFSDTREQAWPQPD